MRSKNRESLDATVRKYGELKLTDFFQIIPVKFKTWLEPGDWIESYFKTVRNTNNYVHLLSYVCFGVFALVKFVYIAAK